MNLKHFRNYSDRSAMSIDDEQYKIDTVFDSDNTHFATPDELDGF